MGLKAIERTLILEFIQIYRDNPCLWKTSSSEYSNKKKKNKAISLLFNKLKEWDENARRDDVQKKINNLRSAFRREFKKYEGSEDVYTPQLWYFNEMMFIKDQDVSRKPRSTTTAADHDVHISQV